MVENIPKLHDLGMNMCCVTTMMKYTNLQIHDESYTVIEA